MSVPRVFWGLFRASHGSSSDVGGLSTTALSLEEAHEVYSSDSRRLVVHATLSIAGWCGQSGPLLVPCLAFWVVGEPVGLVVHLHVRQRVRLVGRGGTRW